MYERRVSHLNSCVPTHLEVEVIVVVPDNLWKFHSFSRMSKIYCTTLKQD